MAIAVNNHQYVRYQNNSNSYTLEDYAAPAGSDRVLAVTVSLLLSNENGVNITGVTFGGNALTAAVPSTLGARGTSTNRSYYCGIWYLVAPSVTTADIVVSLSGNHAGCIISAVVLTGVDQVAPVSGYGVASVTDDDIAFTNASGSSDTGPWAGDDGDLNLFAVMANANNNPTWGWSGGASELYDDNGGSNSNNEVAGAGGYASHDFISVTCSLTPNRTVGVAVGFVEAAPDIIEASAEDAVDFAPVAARHALLGASAADLVDIARTLLPRRVLRATAIESMGMSGGTGRRADFVGLPIDLLELLETAAGGQRYPLTASDAAILSDGGAGHFLIIATAADTWHLTPAVARRAEFVGTAVDVLALEGTALYPMPSEQGSFEIEPYEDARQGLDGNVDITNNIGSVFANNPYGALEFHEIDVPKGAIPTSFYLKLWPDTHDDPGLTIRLQKDAEPATLTTTNGDISDRTPFTDAGTEWSGANIGTGAYKNSPDFSAAGQEVFALAEWERGGNIVVVLINNGTGGRLQYVTSEGSSDKRPKLVCEWYLGGLTISATAADTLALAAMAGRQALIGLAIADAASYAAAATTTLALLVVDDAGLSEMLGTLGRLSVGDTALLSAAVGLAFAFSVGDVVKLAETLTRIGTTQGAVTDALRLAATARTRIGTAAGDALELSAALNGRRTLAAVLSDPALIGYVLEGDMAGILEAIAQDDWRFAAAAYSGWTAGATASDAAEVADTVASIRRFLGLAADTGQIGALAAAVLKARADGLDAAEFAGQLHADWSTHALDVVALSAAVAEHLAVILYALAADVAAITEGTSTVWHVQARDTAEFVASLAAIMHWVETVQEAIGFEGVSAFVNPAGIVVIEIRMAQATVAIEVAMPGATMRLVQPVVETDLRPLD